MKKLYFLVFAFVGLFSAAVTVAAECPADDRSIHNGEQLPDSAERTADFLTAQLRDGFYQRSQKLFLNRTLNQLIDENNKEKYIKLRIAEMEYKEERKIEERRNKRRKV